MPPCIGRLTSLNRLDLHSNSIQQLPEELGQLRKVRQNTSILCVIISAAQTPTPTHDGALWAPTQTVHLLVDVCSSLGLHAQPYNLSHLPHPLNKLSASLVMLLLA